MLLMILMGCKKAPWLSFKSPKSQLHGWFLERVPGCSGKQFSHMAQNWNFLAWFDLLHFWLLNVIVNACSPWEFDHKAMKDAQVSHAEVVEFRQVGFGFMFTGCCVWMNDTRWVVWSLFGHSSSKSISHKLVYWLLDFGSRKRVCTLLWVYSWLYLNILFYDMYIYIYIYYKCICAK